MIVKLLEIEEKQTLNSVEKNFQRKEFSETGADLKFWKKDINFVLYFRHLLE